ncbi:MAG TPA: hypothetical protein VG106_11390, partial [Vicinamibacterales bacterium]|nr:hypothetical protein [Vicinamibacterales bacterium]
MTETMNIDRVETFVVSLPIHRPHYWVGLTAPSGRGYLVLKLTLSNGVVGWGESQPIQSWGGDDASRYGEIPQTAIAVLEHCIVPALKDVDVRQLEQLHAAMNRAVRGYPYAKAAL